MKPDTLAPDLARLAEEETPVRVTRADGKTFDGVLVATEEADAYKVATGRRGRPAIVHVLDVEGVEPLSAEEG